MKYLLVLLGLIALMVAMPVIFTKPIGAQQPSPTGEDNALVAACQLIEQNAANNGARVLHCRRAAPDEFSGNYATVHLNVIADVGTVNLTVHLYRSVWQITGAEQ